MINRLKIKKVKMKIVRLQYGYCPICNKPTIFWADDYWLRDHYRCLRCHSIPRQRALVKVLKETEQNFCNKIIHESSPNGPNFVLFKKMCVNYTYSYYYPNVELGLKLKNGSTCENIEQLTLANNSIDIFITQDVLEHINHPDLALKEIERVLKPGGFHIFTVPLYPFIKTRNRINVVNGNIEYILPPVYHKNPVDESGSLVTYDWGGDLSDSIEKWTEMETTIIEFYDSKENFSMGLEADFLHVIICRKPNK